jgi:hypothetical protein
VSKSFEEWMKTVDAHLSNRAGGMTSADLPDCCYGDWYEDGLSPSTAARKAIRVAQGEED